MPTANQKIFDSYVRHQIEVLRFADDLVGKMLPTLAGGEKRLGEIIKAAVERGPTKGWQSKLANAVRTLREPQWEEIDDRLHKDMREFASYQASGAARAIQGAVPTVLGLQLPQAAHLAGIVNSYPFHGHTLKGWMNRTAAADVARILQGTKLGIINGQTPAQVAGAIVGSPGRGGKRGAIARKAFRDMEATVLTVANGVQHQARSALYEANSDIINSEQYVATLDSRTTVICMGLDGKQFKVGEGTTPPAHFRCRSIRIPYINPDNLGDRPFNPATEKELVGEYAKREGIKAKSRKALPRGHKTKFDAFARRRRRELMGRVPARTNYNDWLKTQSEAFQVKVLGPERAKLFREGMPVDKFVTAKGKVRTLKQLGASGPPPGAPPVEYVEMSEDGEGDLKLTPRYILDHKNAFNVEGMTTDEANALKKYQSSSYGMNMAREFISQGMSDDDVAKMLLDKKLARGPGNAKTLVSQARHLMSAMDKSAGVDANRILFRGTKNWSKEDAAQFVAGGVFKNGRFSSTSLSRKQAMKFVHGGVPNKTRIFFEIEVPEGHPAIWVSGNTPSTHGIKSHDREVEWLLSAGEFDIVSVSDDEDVRRGKKVPFKRVRLRPIP